MKHIGIAIFFTFFLDCFPGFSQQTQIDIWLDSLKQPSLPPPTQISLHIKLGKAFNNTDPAKAEEQALHCIELAHSLGDIISEVHAYHILGNSHVFRGDYEEAMKNFFEALTLAESVNDLNGIANSLKNIGGIQFSLRQYDKALEYASRGLEIQKKINDSTGIADGLFAVGLLESRLGLDSASIAHYEQALSIYNLLDNKGRQAGIYHNLSEDMFNMGDLAKALEYSLLSVNLRRATGSKRGLASSLNRYAELNLHTGSYDSARVILDESLKISRELGLQPQLRDNYLFRARLDSIQKDYKNAFFHYKKYTSLKDSILKSKNQNLLLDLENRHIEARQLAELKAKDAMIEKQWIIVLTVFIVLLAVLIILGMLYRNYTRNQKINDTLAIQKSHIQSQNNQLAELNKVKDKWFSIISHDFRSPLTFLQGAMNLLNTGDLNEDEMRMLTVEVEDRVKRTAILLDNLMFWAQSHLDGIQLRNEVVDVFALVQQLEVKFKQDFNAKSILFENRLPSPAMFKSDPDLISLISHNLIEFLLTYSKNGERIVVEGKKQKNQLEFRIRSSGLKISQEEKMALFKMDNSLIKAGNAAERAIGLGLVLCKDFLEKVGSSIHIEHSTEFPTTFCFSVPLSNISVGQK